MSETKIIIISRRGPRLLWQKIRQGLGLAPKKAGHRIFGDCDLLKEKIARKKT